jgi:hypothetical protein
MKDSELLELCDKYLDYNSSTGVIRNKINRGPKSMKGTIAGTLRPDGYLSIFLSGNRYLSHRLAYLIFHKKMPQLVDHINQNKSDNSINNLRGCGYSENHYNCGARVRNKSSYKGVHLIKSSGKWSVSLQVNKKKMHFGRFNCKHCAAKAWNTAARMHQGHKFCYTNEVKECLCK